MSDSDVENPPTGAVAASSNQLPPGDGTGAVAASSNQLPPGDGTGAVAASSNQPSPGDGTGAVAAVAASSNQPPPGDGLPEIIPKKKQKKNPETKTFRDPIYGDIELHPLLVAIINTPEFERLRHIKQLGGKCYVYPAASHSRFEHSIGVCHLAGQLIRHLINEQPELNITIKEILIVEIAGLCHDLGHGPFSHLWDQRFQTETKHEEVSKTMLKKVFERSNVEAIADSYGFSDQQLERACDLIKRDKSESLSLALALQGPDREFLYEIVDSPNDIDVDKWDYFTRDCHYLGLQHGFDLWRLLKTARVMKDGHIAYRDKAIHDIKEMFHTRTVLHEKAYQHKTGRAVEMMIADAFKKADEGGFKFQYANGSTGATCKISKATKDPVAFLALTDNVLVEQIKYASEASTNPSEASTNPSEASTNPIENIKMAGKLLTRIAERDLYTLVHEFETTQPKDDPKDKIKKWLLGSTVAPSDWEVDVSIIEDKLNTEKIRIYSKRELGVATLLKDLEDIIIPEKKPTKFIVRLFYKGPKDEWESMKGNEEVKKILTRFNKKEFEKLPPMNA